MNNIKQQNQRAPLQPLESGQIWQMEDSTLQVERVGDAQVHYKLVKPNGTAPSVSSIKVVETFLTVRRATLLQA